MKFGTIQAGEVRVGPLLLLLGIAVHLIFPLGLLYLALTLDRALGISLGLPLWVRLPVGGGVFGLALATEAWATPLFFRVGGSPAPLQPTRELVVSGPYRYCRHPIYLAYIGYLVGLGIVFNALSVIVAALLFWLMLGATARFYEEPRLRARFGEAFEQYRRTTPFMLPRPHFRERGVPAPKGVG